MTSISDQILELWNQLAEEEKKPLLKKLKTTVRAKPPRKKSPADELPDCEYCSSTTEYHPPIITRNGRRQFDPSRRIGRS